MTKSLRNGPKVNKYLVIWSTFISATRSIIDFFINKSIGVLFTVCTIYFLLNINGQHVFSFSELMIWLSIQNPEIIASIVSTIITVLGFLIAYSSGVATWKKQQYFSLQQDLYKDIDKFFSKFSSLLTDCKIFINFTIELKENIDNNQETQRSKFMLGYMHKKFEEWIANQEKLTLMQSEYSDLTIKHSPIIISNYFTSMHIDKAEEAIDSIIKHSFISLHPGIKDVTDENYKEAFYLYSRHVDLDICRKAVNEFERCQKILTDSSSSIKSGLLHPVITPNFSFILNGFRILNKIKK